MNTNWKFLAIDLGAESGRCVAAILKDQHLILHEVHRFKTYSFIIQESIRWDITQIFEEIIKGLSKAVELFGPDFTSIGIDSWGVDYVLVDNDGKYLGYPHHYRDNRTDGIKEEVFKIIPEEKIYNFTGIQAAQYNTLYQLAAEKKNKLNPLRVAHKLLIIPDYFSYLLCGEKKAEYTIASTTNLTNPHTRNWSWELIDHLGFTKNLFPQIVESGTKLGKLKAEIVKRTGICADVPVVAVAAHDTASAVLSIPFYDDNHLFISSGTWTLIGAELDDPVINVKAMNLGFTNEGGAFFTNLLLKNLIGLWPLQECKRIWNETENSNLTYQQLTEIAVTEGFVNAWIDPGQPDFFKPGDMPQKVIRFLNNTEQQYRNEKGFIVGVILESLVFSFRKVLADIQELTGIKPNVLHITGGGIKNELFIQYISDATGLPVFAGPVEGTVIGNAGIQAITCSAVKNIKQWRDIINNSFNIKIYNPVNKDYFNHNEKNFFRILDKKQRG